MSRIDIYILVFICFSMLLAFASCKDKGDQTFNKQALTENDFSKDPELRVDLNGGVLATFLEHPDSTTERIDTGVVGRDIIPLTYAITTSHTFCWKDDDQESNHFMTLNDINGIEIVRVLANGKCKAETIEPGDYDMILHHDGRIEDTFTVLLVNQEDEFLILTKKESDPNRSFEKQSFK